MWSSFFQSTWFIKVRSFLPFLLILAYGALFHFTAETSHLIGNYESETDFYWTYVPDAKALSSGEMSFSTLLYKRGAFYFLILAILKPLFRDWFIAGRFLSLFSACFCLILGYHLVRTLFGQTTGWLCFLALASNFIFQRHSYEVGYDMFNLMLLLISLSLVFAKKRSPARIFIGGFIGGLAFLTRFNMVILLPFFIFTGFSGLRLRAYDYYRSLSSAAGFLVVYGSWMVNNVLRTGKFYSEISLLTMVRDFHHFKSGSTGVDSAATEFFRSNSSLLDLFMLDPFLFMKKWIYGIGVYIYQDINLVLGIPITVMIVVGIGLLRFSKLDKAQIRLLIFLVFSVLILGLSHFELRFSLAHLLIYMILAVHPLGSLIARTSGSIRGILYGVLVFFILIIGCLNFRLSLFAMQAGPAEILPIAAHIRENSQYKNMTITARKPHIGYYADLPWFPLHMSPVDQIQTPELLAHWAVKNKIKLLYWSEIEHHVLPNLRFLDKVTLHGAWQPVIYSKKAVLYELSLPTAESLK
ncbi:ArnT family glycosyltransferase [candidate division CSSED10-310 bacterium]|uniref:ArnT family glycosyltransferase n=1 Tax=candidate division CSSED10-310 bacterium TaxID=2855610 RepID=A0ABV6Z6J4_UNCC1